VSGFLARRGFFGGAGKIQCQQFFQDGFVSYERVGPRKMTVVISHAVLSVFWPAANCAFFHFAPMQVYSALPLLFSCHWFPCLPFQAGFFKLGKSNG
jgi:hypothetical protein